MLLRRDQRAHLGLGVEPRADLIFGPRSEIAFDHLVEDVVLEYRREPATHTGPS